MQAPLSHARSLKPYVALAPIVAGLALSHTAMMVASFNGLTNGFEALRSGLATCIAAVPMLVAMAILYRARGPLPEKSVDTAFFISIIVQSGSVRDEEVIQACDEHGIAMVFTGHRHFRH